MADKSDPNIPTIKWPGSISIICALSMLIQPHTSEIFVMKLQTLQPLSDFLVSLNFKMCCKCFLSLASILYIVWEVTMSVTIFISMDTVSRCHFLRGSFSFSFVLRSSFKNFNRGLLLPYKSSQDQPTATHLYHCIQILIFSKFSSLK